MTKKKKERQRKTKKKLEKKPVRFGLEIVIIFGGAVIAGLIWKFKDILFV